MGRWDQTVLLDVVRKFQPTPRVVDWSIFGFVVFEMMSGLFSFTVSTPEWWPLFWAHRIVGLSLVVLLGLKLVRVRYRLTNREKWEASMVITIIALFLVVSTIITGIAWVGGLDVQVSYWTLLSIHVGLGLVLVPFMLIHMRTRFRFVRRVDFEARRNTLQYTIFLLLGILIYRGQEVVNRVLQTHGDDRRFTGSQPREGSGNTAFPITMWVADDPAPIDLESYTLRVDGEVETTQELEYDSITIESEREAVLDCTSGWYTVQRWRGLGVGDLLDSVGVTADARYVRFVSVTGYRWSLPIDEARNVLLATHVGDEPLTHGHGAPLRLVAPGRRGFQWVKWVIRVEVRKRNDPLQWLVTLISGFTETR